MQSPKLLLLGFWSPWPLPHCWPWEAASGGSAVDIRGPGLRDTDMERWLSRGTSASQQWLCGSCAHVAPMRDPALAKGNWCPSAPTSSLERPRSRAPHAPTGHAVWPEVWKAFPGFCPCSVEISWAGTEVALASRARRQMHSFLTLEERLHSWESVATASVTPAWSAQDPRGWPGNGPSATHTSSCLSSTSAAVKNLA